MDYLHLDAGFTANEAMMPLKGIACNLILGFRTEVGTPRFRRMTVARLRRELLLIAWPKNKPTPIRPKR